MMHEVMNFGAVTDPSTQHLADNGQSTLHDFGLVSKTVEGKVQADPQAVASLLFSAPIDPGKIECRRIGNDIWLETETFQKRTRGLVANR
jgi:hypothetical protein